MWLLLEKFLFQRPLYRSSKVLELERFFASQGTLTDGLKHIGEFIQPLYTKILERSRVANPWQMDETRWLVFVEVAGKVGHRQWLWVVITQDICVYLLGSSRSAEVPKNHLGENAEGIISADRYSAHKALAESGRFLIAFCWFHVRQDYFRIHKEYPKLRAWADGWLERINDLFARNAPFLDEPERTEGQDSGGTSAVMRPRGTALVEARTGDYLTLQATIDSTLDTPISSLAMVEAPRARTDYPESPRAEPR